MGKLGLSLGVEFSGCLPTRVQGTDVDSECSEEP